MCSCTFTRLAFRPKSLVVFFLLDRLAYRHKARELEVLARVDNVLGDGEGLGEILKSQP